MNNLDESKKTSKKKWFVIPHTYGLLFIVIIVVTILTYILPAGEFDRAEDPSTGRVFVVAESFHNVERNPLSIFDMFKAIPGGMEKAGYIIFFVFMIGGAFGIIQSTGAINAGIGKVVVGMKGREKLVIPVIMIVFSLAGAVLGSAEELLPFYPIVISLALALGFDSMTGTAMVLVGAGAGFAGAFLNPFTIGISQGIAGLPMFSGIGFRLIGYFIFVGTTVIYVYRYASKIQKNPKLSLTYDADKTKLSTMEVGTVEEFTIRHRLVLLVVVLGLSILGYGVVKLGFYITELTAIFLMIGIVAGIVGGMSIDKIAEKFVDGAKEMTYGALVIGLATSIMVVLNEGRILDTIIYSLSSCVQGLPSTLSATGMFIVQSIISVVIPSGSGMAAATMPIMAPLADLVGITRQTAVLAYQFGDALTNVMSPTSGYFMAALAIGGISWSKWARWLLPLFIIWNIEAIALLVISVLMNYGPF